MCENARILQILNQYPREQELIRRLANDYMIVKLQRKTQAVAIGYWPKERSCVGYPRTNSTPFAPDEQAYICDRFFKIIKLFNCDLTQYKGSSRCRLCDKRNNGSSEYKFGKYVIPTGYEHYLRDHGVAPDPLVFEIIDKYGCLLDLPAEILQFVTDICQKNI